MAQNKFLTIDLTTGKRILKNLEASLVNFNPEGLNGITGTNLQDALKEEVLRALAAEGALNKAIEAAVETAKTADEAIKTIIGAIPEGQSVKSELDRIEALVSALTSKVDGHIANSEIHVTTEDKTKWNKVVTDLEKEVSDRKAADTALQGAIDGKAEKVHTHVMADITDLSAALDAKADKTFVNQELAKKVEKVELFAGGKIKTDLLPSIAINDAIVVKSAEEAMDAVIENGDIVIINPDAVDTLAVEENLPESGTFICVNAEAETFAEKFRQLYSHGDAINKADAQQMVNVEKDRALAAEQALGQRIDDEKNEATVGSLANKIKVNKDAIAAETAARSSKDTELEQKIDGEINRATAEESRIAGLVDAEKTAREKADEAINSSIEELTTKVDKLQAQNELAINVVISDVEVGNLLAIDSDGSIVKATYDNDNVVGIVIEAGEGTAKVAIMGKVNLSGVKELEAGKDYFVGNDGSLVETCPQEVGKHILKVGKALSTNELLVKIEDAISIM